MDELTPMTANPPVDNRDIDQMIAGLQHGTYASRDLFNLYARVARSNGREPGSITAFGAHLGALGLRNRRIKNKRAWTI